MFVCVISNQITSKKPHCVRPQQTWILVAKNTHQGLSGTRVPRLDMFKSILSLSKIAHQMCCDHPFSQRNRKTERTVGVGVGGDKEVWGLDKTWKGGSGKQYRGDLHKIVGLAPLCQLRKETFPSPHYKTHPQHKLFFMLVTIIEREKISTQNTKKQFFSKMSSIL